MFLYSALLGRLKVLTHPNILVSSYTINGINYSILLLDPFSSALARFGNPCADDEVLDGDQRPRGERGRRLEQHGSAHQPEAGRGGGGGDAAAARVDEGRGPISAVPHSLVSLVVLAV